MSRNWNVKPTTHNVKRWAPSFAAVSQLWMIRTRNVRSGSFSIGDWPGLLVGVRVRDHADTLTLAPDG
jgi:hypothetical protein